jgi:hypothetical protein
MDDGAVQVRVQLDLGNGAEAAELEEDTLRLREELLELGVADVHRPSPAAAPEGAKGIDAAVLGSLVISAGQEAVAAIVRAVASFVTRGTSRSVKLQLGDDVIELSGASRADQERLIEAFLARHGAEGS